jgi:hypothetical protein
MINLSQLDMNNAEPINSHLFNIDISEPTRRDEDVIDPRLLGPQYDAIKKSSERYFKKPPVYPHRTVLKEMPEYTPAGELEINRRKYIIYDPDIPSELKERAAIEEAIHLQQEGKEVLLPLHIVYFIETDEGLIPLADVPIGRILYEGGIRTIAEKSDLKKPNGYPKFWYDMAKDIEETIPLRVWYSTAQRDADTVGKPYKVLDLMENSQIRKIIDKYVLNPKPMSKGARRMYI